MISEFGINVCNSYNCFLALLKFVNLALFGVDKKNPVASVNSVKVRGVIEINVDRY